MQRSIHYYVLSLSEKMNRLYEGFRDKLIDIQDKNFPFEVSIDTGNPPSKDTQIRDFIQQTNQRFAYYYEQDPLRLVVLGEKNNLAIFEALTTHQDILIGMIEGNYTGQMAQVIRQETGLKMDHFFLKYDGQPFYPSEICRKVKEIL